MKVISQTTKVSLNGATFKRVIRNGEVRWFNQQGYSMLQENEDRLEKKYQDYCHQEDDDKEAIDLASKVAGGYVHESEPLDQPPSDESKPVTYHEDWDDRWSEDKKLDI